MAAGKTLAANQQGLASDIMSMLNYGLATNIPATGSVVRDSLYCETDTKVLRQEQNGSWVAIGLVPTAGKFTLAQLVDAVCSETEADGKITTHKNDPNAHHTPGDIALNKVKLPSPSVSDYVTPSAVLASSEHDTGWLNPTGYNDPSSHYTDEPLTYDNDIGTHCDSANSAPSTWSPYLDLTFAEQLVGKIRLYLNNDGNDWPSNGKASIDLWYGAAWHNVWESTLSKMTWKEISFTPQTITKIRAKFYNATGSNRHVYLYELQFGMDFLAQATIDNILTTQWRPSPANEAGAWCRWDMGALKITSGCRIYWGADANYRPTNYDIDVSENGTDWIQVVNETGAAPASAWKEYSWNARYTRYIRIQVNTHGATGTEVFEADYYSRITDRVAAEHGHGSGITKHLEEKHSKGHPTIVRGASLRSKVRDLPSLIEYMDFMLKGQE